MSIVAYKINLKGNLPIQTQAKTLDEMTRELPQGFYTTFSTLANGTKVLGLHTHLQRLYDPALAQGLNPAVNELALRSRVAEFAKSNLPHESRIRLILTKNDGAIYIGIQPFEPLPKQIYENGVKVISTELARQSPRVKDTGFISSSAEQRKQVGGDVFEVLMKKGGKILEGMSSNFYAIQGSTLVTANHGILPGVTRRVILRLARGQGISILYHSPNINEKFNEAFLTSSSRGVMPIISIDDRPVGQGRVGRFTSQLARAYNAYVLEKAEVI